MLYVQFASQSADVIDDWLHEYLCLGYETYAIPLPVQSYEWNEDTHQRKRVYWRINELFLDQRT